MGLLDGLIMAGGATDAYQKQREAAARAAVQQMALQKYQQEQADLSFLGSLPGSVFQPASGSGGINLPGMTPAGPAQRPPMMPPPAAPAAAPPPPPMQGQPTGNASAAPIEVAQLGPPGGGTVGGAGAAATAPIPPKPQTSDVIGRDTNIYNIPTEPEPPAAAAAPPSAADTGNLSPEVAQQQFTNPIAQQLFAHLSREPLTLGTLIDRIKEAKPGADPGQVARAAMLAYQMVEKGDAAQQNFGLKALAQLRLLDEFGQKEQRLTRQGDARIGIAERNATRAERQGDEKLRQGDRRIEQGDKRLSQSREQFEQRMNEARGSKDRAERMRRLTAELSSIDRQTGQIRNDLSLGASEKAAQLKELQQRRAEVIAEMNKGGAAGPTER